MCPMCSWVNKSNGRPPDSLDHFTRHKPSKGIVLYSDRARELVSSPHLTPSLFEGGTETAAAAIVRSFSGAAKVARVVASDIATDGSLPRVHSAVISEESVRVASSSLPPPKKRTTKTTTSSKLSKRGYSSSSSYAPCDVFSSNGKVDTMTTMMTPERPSKSRKIRGAEEAPPAFSPDAAISIGQHQKRRRRLSIDNEIL